MKKSGKTQLFFNHEFLFKMAEFLLSVYYRNLERLTVPAEIRVLKLRRPEDTV